MDNFNFNMNQIGRRISELRRERDMTQLELADRLGISYQAVSNWERGSSMPDIAKLPELAGIFDVTVDQLLGKTNGLLNSVMEDEVEAYMEQEQNEIVEEFVEAASVLKPSQADAVFEGLVEKEETFDFGEIRMLLPFLGREVVEKLAWKCADSPEWEKLSGIAPFLAGKTVAEIAEKLTGEGKPINFLLPFLGKDVIDGYAERAYVEKGMKGVSGYLPFLSSEKVMEIGRREYEENGMRNLRSLAPFLAQRDLTVLAEDAIGKGGIKAIAPILPFVDEKVLAEYVSKKYL